MANIEKLERNMSEIIKDIDSIRVDICKARERLSACKIYNRSAFARLRKTLISMQKKGAFFRKESVSYEKAVKKEKKELVEK